jgi:hypothetical protein
LEKYDEIDDEDKKDINKLYVKLKGKLWVEWYDLKEEADKGMDEEDGEEGEEEEGEEEEGEEEEGEEEEGEEEEGLYRS